MDIETSTQPTFREGSVSQKIIEPLQIYDPLLVLLKVKLRLNNWWVIRGALTDDGRTGKRRKNTEA